MMGIETMKSVSPKTVDRSTLVQRSSIRLDPAASQEVRLREFIKQIRNPYCYLDGKTVVKISFAETDTTMEDCLEHYLSCLLYTSMSAPIASASISATFAVTPDAEKYATSFLLMVFYPFNIFVRDVYKRQAEFWLRPTIRNRRNDLCKLLAVKVKGKFQAIAASESLSDMLAETLPVPFTVIVLIAFSRPFWNRCV